jgi:hypothetical protein
MARAEESTVADEPAVEEPAVAATPAEPVADASAGEAGEEPAAG